MNDVTATACNVIPVNFHLRLAPQKDAHDELLRTRMDLVQTFSQKYRKGRIADIQLYPVERAGKSGSEVFYLDVSLRKQSFPVRFIAKFQDRAKTKKEAQAAEQAEDARLCSGVYSFLHGSENLGIIVYKLVAAPDHTEFRGFFLDESNTAGDCVTALRSALELVGKFHNSEEPKKKMVDDYRKYVERPSRPLLKLTALINAESDEQALSNLAESVLSGYEKICREYNVDVHGYLVHGDLHARNLMISKQNPARTELIDFDWVHFGHPAKDFVLMEITIKYMLLAEFVSRTVRRTPGCEENPHISVKCIRLFEQFLVHGGMNLPPVASMTAAVLIEGTPAIQQIAITRAYECIVEIRRSANLVLNEYCNHDADVLSPYDHYLVSSYLVTCGLLAIQDVNHIPAMIGLSAISEHLNANDPSRNR
ncbi:phosphotransferase [Stenotrophomonas maltophilia]|uniref:phosphotransferase n=1 Tax=Stenotrophomonas maltophilia TaxID=40324 RepID=UPI0011B617FF|nr:phosphotransferase [Stenotrophomonas maltophilia]